MSSGKLKDAMSKAAGTRPGLGRAGWKPPSRRGKKGVLIHVDPELARQLRIPAAIQDRSLQAVGLEALENILKRYGPLP